MKATLIYAVTPEFTSHLLTSVLPRDNDDPVSGSEGERRTINLGDLGVWAFSFSFFRFFFFSQQATNAFVLVDLCGHTIIFHRAEQKGEQAIW